MITWSRSWRVSTDEVEEVFANKPRVRRLEGGDVQGEDLYRALGQADDGRYLAVFFVYKGAAEALVIPARDMSDKERRSYGKQKK